MALTRLTNLSLLFLASALVLASADVPAPTCQPLLEAARDCNLWVHSDAVMGTGQVHGKVCVGGDMSSPGGLTVGTNIPGSQCEDGEYSLVVAGDLSWPTGRKAMKAHCIGGSLGPVDGQGPLGEFSCPDNSIEDANGCTNVIDFESDHSILLALSDDLADGSDAYVASTADVMYGAITMTLDASAGSRHMVEMDATLFDGYTASQVGVDVQNGDLNDIDVVVVNLINVPASGFVSRKWFSYPESFASKVLFNYNGPYSISAEWTALKASVLAPRATFIGMAHSVVMGQIIVEAYAPAGGSQTVQVNNELLSAVVEDTLVARAMDITVDLDASGAASISAADVDDGSFGTCGIASMTVSPTSFDCSHVSSPVLVTLEVVDHRGNVETATAYVTVRDRVAPVVATQNIVVQLDANGSATISAEQVDDGSSDACGIGSMSVDPMSFDCSHVGDQTVTLTVTDVNGNVATATATATIEDNVAPAVRTRDIEVLLTNTPGGEATITAAQVDDGSSDACGIASMSVEPAAFDCSHVGDQTVTLTVTDIHGNVATKTATATVRDLVPPNVALEDITVQLDASGAVSITAAQLDSGSHDNCGIASMSVYPDTFNCSHVEGGPVTVTVTVTDIHGNSASNTAVVTVEDKIAPNVVTQSVVVQLDEEGAGSIVAEDVDGGSTDACGIDSMSVSRTEFTCADVSSPVTVTLTVVDVHANAADANATVTVQDTIPPTLICRDRTVYLDLSGHGSLVADDLVANVSDNCGVLTVSANRTQFGLEQEGDNAVTVTAFDVNGRTSTCIANVEVVAGCMGECPGQCMHQNIGDNSCAALVECTLGVDGRCHESLDTLAENNRNIPCGDTLCYCPAGSDYCGPSNVGTLGLNLAFESESKAFEAGNASAEEAESSTTTLVTSLLVGVIVLLSLALLAVVRSARNSAAHAAAHNAQSAQVWMDLHGKAADLSPSALNLPPAASAKLSLEPATDLEAGTGGGLGRRLSQGAKHVASQLRKASAMLSPKTPYAQFDKDAVRGDGGILGSAIRSGEPARH